MAPTAVAAGVGTRCGSLVSSGAALIPDVVHWQKSNTVSNGMCTHAKRCLATPTKACCSRNALATTYSVGPMTNPEAQEQPWCVQCGSHDQTLSELPCTHYDMQTPWGTWSVRHEFKPKRIHCQNAEIHYLFVQNTDPISLLVGFEGVTSGVGR